MSNTAQNVHFLEFKVEFWFPTFEKELLSLGFRLSTYKHNILHPLCASSTNSSCCTADLVEFHVFGIQLKILDPNFFRKFQKFYFCILHIKRHRCTKIHLFYVKTQRSECETLQEKLLFFDFFQDIGIHFSIHSTLVFKK